MTAPIGPTGPFGVSPLERGGMELRGGETIGEPQGGPSFASLLKKGLTDASDLQDASKDITARFLRGEPVELHQVMAAGEEAGLAIEILVEMRNKLTEAYRSIMNTQI